MTTITDEVKRTDLPNTLSLSDGLLNSASRKVVQYTYSGIEGLKVGGFYGAHSKRNNNALDLANHRKDVWGLAAIYKHKIDDRQSVTAGTGISRERFEKTSNSTYDVTAYALGLAYTYDKTTVGLDLERRVTDNQGSARKGTEKEVRTVLHQKLTDQWNAYTMYAYKTAKVDYISSNDTEAKKHQFMLGSEYYIVPTYLKGFVEWKTTRTQNYAAGQKTTKSRNNETVIGLRAYW